MNETSWKWRIRLRTELSHRSEFARLSRAEWSSLLAKRRVTSSNHDTVLAIDWPHYCANATVACGGPAGWCYTFGGKQAGREHSRHVAMVDTLARNYPDLFGERVAAEAGRAVERGLLPYPNVRYSGSGETTFAHLAALREAARRGVWLWGFTRNVQLACELRSFAGVIFSCDHSTSSNALGAARAARLPLAYTSRDVDDVPPPGTVVTFPLHRGGKVAEVVDSESLCPKVLFDFFEGVRPSATCQTACMRCHMRSESAIR